MYKLHLHKWSDSGILCRTLKRNLACLIVYWHRGDGWGSFTATLVLFSGLEWKINEVGLVFFFFFSTRRAHIWKMMSCCCCYWCCWLFSSLQQHSDRLHALMWPMKVWFAHSTRLVVEVVACILLSLSFIDRQATPIITKVTTWLYCITSI